MAIKRNQKRRGRSLRVSSVNGPRNDSTDRASSIYADMVSEASVDPIVRHERPLKRRKGVESDSLDLDRQGDSTRFGELSPGLTPLKAPVQTVYDDSPSDNSDDLDWEEIDLETDTAPKQDQEDNGSPQLQDVSIVLGKNENVPKKSRPSTRLPSSAADKKMRLEIHKLHLCCLLTHLHIRNAWCNDKLVQAKLKPLLSRRTVSYLNPAKNMSQFQQSRSFVDGLGQAIDIWRPLFKVNVRGTRRANWVKDVKEIDQADTEEDLDTVMTSREDFVECAVQRYGSRDTGAQLFCALVRSAGVDARLVCSLQPLPFTNPPPVGSPTQSKKIVVHADEVEADVDDNDNGHAAYALDAEASSHGPTRIRRLGQSSSAPARDLGKAIESPSKPKKVVDSPYPVYWVEAFNDALQKWIPVDPIVTGTIAKPMKFEPPASDSLNDMTYVIAFEDDGTAKDVTRRYAKAYNAKTRRRRVEVTKDGRKWWKKAMKAFHSGLEADRDQVEDAELANREASESLPRNVQDFKDHPFYALERHLRHNEVIHPRREVGKLSTGKTSSAVEPIYRRKHVELVRTADKWYREGREIIAREQPLKYAASRRRRLRDLSPDSEAFEGEDQDQQGVGLYAKFQTELYVPPSVVKGKVPKNTFGNLDIYVPTMIPPGGVHIRVKEAIKAAQILRVDYAEAVTGFEFRGRHGTAVTNGVIVAQQFQDAVEEVVRGLRWQEEQAVAAKRALDALRLWKRFWTGLKIRERVMAYAKEDEEQEQERDVQAQLDDMETAEEQTREEGGFLPDQEVVQATSSHSHKLGSNNMSIEIEQFRRPDSPRLDVGETEELANYDWFPPSVRSPWDHLSGEDVKNRHSNPRESRLNEVPASLEGIEDLGGGFLPEGDQDEGASMGGGGFTSEQPVNIEAYGGGGFLPDGQRGADAQQERGYVQEEDGRSTMLSENTEKENASYLLDSEIQLYGNNSASAREDEQLPKNVAELPSSLTQEPANDVMSVDIKETSQANEHSDSIEEMKCENEDDHTGENGEKSSGGGGDDDDDDDVTSLLSQDPEDEEAEPEWLVDDVGF